MHCSDSYPALLNLTTLMQRAYIKKYKKLPPRYIVSANPSGDEPGTWSSGAHATNPSYASSAVSSDSFRPSMRILIYGIRPCIPLPPLRLIMNDKGDNSLVSGEIEKV